MIGASGATWPDEGQQLLKELEVSRDRYALVVGELTTTNRLVQSLAVDLRLGVVHLGNELAEVREAPPTAMDVGAVCNSGSILTDLDVLLWPALEIPVMPFLAAIARRRPVIAVWPGEITGHRARYSSPGRPDHHDARLTDVVVLRPRTTRFPDEVPYEIERIAQ